MKFTGQLPVASLIETMCAIHLTSYVNSPYKDRGGLMLVGPPGILKTTCLDVLDNTYHNCACISNAFMQTMVKMQASFYNGTIRSLYFPDLQSIYAGDPRTAGRIEQMMMQLSGEATRTVSGGQDSRYSKFKGYCTIFGAMTDMFFGKMSERWEGSGFLRRFIWSTYTLKDPEILVRAIYEWTRANLGFVKLPPVPLDDFIEDTVKPDERRIIHSWLKHQPPPHEIQLQVMCKALSVLKWHYKRSKSKTDPLVTLHEFAETLQKDAALLTFPEQTYDKGRHLPRPQLPQKGNRHTPYKLHRKRKNSKAMHKASPRDNSHQHHDSPPPKMPTITLAKGSSLSEVHNREDEKTEVV